MSGWLQGKVALAAGGGSGIGRAVVEAFVAEGASVCVLEGDPDKCAELAALGPAVAVLEGDGTVAEDNVRAVAEARARFGRLDCLVTFVGIFDFFASVTELDGKRFEAAFAEMFDVNVRSALLAARAAAPALRSSRGSMVVTCSSSSFYPGGGGALYIASKFALRGVVAQLAHELAPDVRVNGVAPGGTVRTDLRGLASLGQEGERVEDRPGRTEGLRARTPLGLALVPEDHVAAYVYLASDRARGCTGEILRTDGGLGVR